MSSMEQHKTSFLISLIFSIIGILLLIFTPFGGWWSYWTGYYYYFGFFTEDTGIMGTALLLPVIILLGYTAWSSYLGFNTPYDLYDDQLERTYQVTKAAVGMVLVLIIIFIVFAIDYDWWFEAGAFGGLISSVINLFIYRNITSSIHQGAYNPQSDYRGTSTPPGGPTSMGGAPQESYHQHPNNPQMNPQTAGTPPNQTHPSSSPSPSGNQNNYCGSCGSEVYSKFCTVCGNKVN